MSEVIINNLDLWTSALLTKSSAGRGSNGKLEAYGIKKLRELILELAVRGKLVPQDPNGEPASVLLERITKAKSRLIKEGKIRKEKPLREIMEEEKNYQLPNGWVFVRLGDVAFSQAGFAFKSRFFNENGEGLPLIRIRDVGQPFSGTYYSGDYREEFLVRDGDYLISMDGDFRVSPWGNEPALLNQRVSRLIFFDESVGKRFIADSLQAQLRELQGVKAYTTVDHLSGTQITESVIGLPPLAEQHRIVAKVDELMALCDQLEQQQTHSLEAHQTLVEILLGTLTSTVRPEPVEGRASTSSARTEFEEAWTRIATHFDTLFTTEHSIDQLKQTILQLAVMGKLVPQDPNNKPASVFLEGMRRERARQIKYGLRKGMSLPMIASDEEPFVLPAGWAWLRFGEMGEVIGGGTPSKSNPRYWGGQIPWVSPKDMKVDFISESIDTISEEAVEGSAVNLVPAGSLLIVVRGMILAHSFPVAITCVPVTVNQDMKAIVIDGFNKNYVLLMVKALKNDFVAMVDRSTHGTCKLVSEKLWAKALPIPPLAEQHRIVAKVDELMSMCDALKAHLDDAQTTRLHLADAIVEQAVA